MPRVRSSTTLPGDHGPPIPAVLAVVGGGIWRKAPFSMRFWTVTRVTAENVPSIAVEIVSRNCPTFKAAACRGERVRSIEWVPATLRDYGVKRRLAAGQILFSEGDPSAGVYEVVSGTLKLEQTDATGRLIVLGFASAGDTIAEASMFAPAYRCDATAMKESVVRVYPKAALFAEFERNPRAAQAFMAVLAHRVTDLRSRLERRSLHSARDRARHYLGLSGQPRNGTVVLSGTLKDLAAELGLTHEVLYRTLSEMEAEGEIVRRQRAITVVGSPYDSDHMSLSQSRL